MFDMFDILVKHATKSFHINQNSKSMSKYEEELFTRYSILLTRYLLAVTLYSLFVTFYLLLVTLLFNR